MPKPAPLTAPARLNLLLPWLNGAFDEDVLRISNRPEDTETFTDPRLVRPAIDAFVQSFDGSAGAAHVEVVDDPSPAHVRRHYEEPTELELEELRVALQGLLAQGFGGVDIGLCAFSCTSLVFAVRGAGRQKPAKRGSTIDGGVTALRNYRAPGAYVLQVEGPKTALVPFLVAHLLTAPGMVAVKRCMRHGCEHFVAETGEAGAPQKFCSRLCREWNRDLEHQQVLKLVAEGRNNKSIADLLGISIKKVMSHRKQKQWRDK